VLFNNTVGKNISPRETIHYIHPQLTKHIHMAKHDELDQLLRNDKMTDKEFSEFFTVLKVKEPVPVLQRVELTNQWVRHSYGHKAVNLFRDCYDPDYSEIIRGTANKLKIPVKETNTLRELEDKIVVEVIEQIREQIIKKEGIEAWEKIEKDIRYEIDRLIAEGALPEDVADELRKLRGAALLAAMIGGRLAGFTLYIIITQAFYAISRWLGLGISVAVAGPIIGPAIAFVLGPAGWILAGLLLAFDLGNTEWGKVIPAVVLAIAFRRRFEYGEL
jgi:uncharacterized protein YaaW (UPF0174 family)